MTSRDRESGTTQRRSVHPRRGLESHAGCLVVLQGQRLGQRIDIGEKPLVIGRAPECEFQILERSVSRHHAKIWHARGGFRIQDLDSTNKTLVNDQPIIEAELKDGDHVTIGSYVLKFMERSSVEARYHDEIYQLATLDPLTGLHNRRHFLELVEREITRNTGHGRPLSLLIVDLDHFKSINDRFGHPAGDVVLREVTAALRALVSGETIAARIGGEEFAIVLPEQDLDAAARFAQGLCDRVAALELDEHAGTRSVTVSIGVATWAASMSSVADLLRAADNELYRAKQGGRNRVCAGGT